MTWADISMDSIGIEICYFFLLAMFHMFGRNKASKGLVKGGGR